MLFKGNMRSPYFQPYMSLSVFPFIRQKFPYQHGLLIDNVPKHTSGSIRQFLLYQSCGNKSKFFDDGF